ncbi:hypothetical protein IJT17_03910 [bacterium]|nr:hypothetical protein [bacterium]
MNKKLLVSLLAVLALLIAVRSAADAQILLVTGEYRITHVDRSKLRLGVCLRDADPDRRQNWVYVNTNTVLTHRIFFGDGSFKDETMDWSSFFDLASKGAIIKVHGGRDWDMSIDAKHIWI